MPAAAAFVALADPQVEWTEIGAGVLGEVGEGGRAGGCRGDPAGAVWALPADEDELAGV
ncbi:hypothetical protein GCM10027075_77750 [Streptomyces heilongjiangensis]